MLAALCHHYYNLTVKVEKRDERYQQLCEDVLTFDMNVKVSEVDELIESRLKLVRAFETYQVTFEKWKETEKKILTIFKQFGIRPRWTLTGEIPGELEYMVWYDLKDNVHIMKTWDLKADSINPNSITSRIADDDDFDDITSALDDDDVPDDDDEETRKLIEDYHKYMKEHGYVSGE